MTRTALKMLVGLGLVVGLGRVLWADAQSDLDSAKRDYESLKSKTDELKDKVEKYLEQSRNLRSMDKDQLDTLVERLCRLDIEPDDREVESIAKDLTDRVVDNVRRKYDDAIRAGSDLVGQIERHLDSVKAVRNRAKGLRSQDAIKDGASRLTDDAEKLVEAVDRLMEKVQSDFKTLDRVKEGVMNGANNPVIRAKLEYGKRDADGYPIFRPVGETYTACRG